MSLFETLRIAVRQLWRNKTRSILTTLGIIIGVAAVIAMVAIGEGAKANVEKQFDAMGTNVVILLPGWTSSGGARGGYGSLPTITYEDFTAIKSLPSVRYAVPVSGTTAQVQSEEQNWTTRITGTQPDYFAIRSWPAAIGSLFTDSDIDGATKVVVLGATVAEKLFGVDAAPVGQMVRIKNIPFQVIGVLDKKGQSPMGQDYDDVTFIPLTTYKTKISGSLSQYVDGAVYISAMSEEDTSRAEQDLTAMLRDRHHVQDGADNDFQVRNLAEIAKAREEGSRTLGALLASIALVSLLVGGIGIMNIMLVSVTERTREIGVRMAVGARPRDILSQFLVEALTLSVAGGLIGVLVGVVIAQRLAIQFKWPMLLRPDVILLAVGFSGLVGIGFGLYPARKASRLDPIDALRFE
jgi:putative ABC transport system permease protein